jgi:transposase
VDQTGNIGKLVISVARSLYIDVAFLTPHDFHQFSQTYSEVKTDALDSYIIADLSVRMTDRLHPVNEKSEMLEELRHYTHYRSELVRDMTRTKNQLHDLLVQVHPALSTLVAGAGLSSEFYPRLFSHYGGSSGLRRAGKKRVTAFVAKLPYYKARAAARVEALFEALCKQTITLPGSAAAEKLIEIHANELLRYRIMLAEINKQIAECFEMFEECRILSSMPGIGEVFSTVILCEIGDIGRFANSGRLAAYSGVAPSKRQSGTSLNGTKKKRKCNRILKNAFCESAWIAAQTDEFSAAFYKKKRAEGKKHFGAVLALARHRVDIIYAMLTNGSVYEPRMIVR